MEQEIVKKFCCFFDNCICIRCCKLSLLQREDLLSAVSVLTDSCKISNVTKRDISQFHFTHSDEK